MDDDQYRQQLQQAAERQKTIDGLKDQLPPDVAAAVRKKPTKQQSKDTPAELFKQRTCRASGCSMPFLLLTLALLLGGPLVAGHGIIVPLWIIAIAVPALGMFYREEREIEADRWRRLFQIIDNQTETTP